MRATVRRVTREELQEQWENTGLNPQTPGDFHGDMGPLAVASAFVRDAAEGNLRDAFMLGDPTWRLCRAQAWIYNNLRQLGLTEQPVSEWNVRANSLARGPHAGSELWEAFISSESDQFKEVLAEYDDDRWGWSQRRRLIGPRHEIVLTIPLPAEAPHGFVAEEPTLLEHVVRILLKCETVKSKCVYLVAGVNVEAPPEPGWPPSWWIVDDPTAVASHPGVTTR